MAVTADVMELPLFVAENVKELSVIFGISADNIRTRLSREKLGKRKRQGRVSGIKFVRVEIDEAEDEK